MKLTIFLITCMLFAAESDIVGMLSGKKLTGSNAENLMQHGIILFNEKKYQEAFPYFMEAYDTDEPQVHARAANYLGIINSTYQNYRESQKYLKEAYSLSKNNGPIEMQIGTASNLGKSLAREEDFDGALTYFNEALDLLKNHSHFFKKNPHVAGEIKKDREILLSSMFQRGRQCRKNGQYTQALTLLTKFYNNSPHDSSHRAVAAEILGELYGEFLDKLNK